MGGLGFHNSRDFNLAMLVTESYRFIKSPEALVSKVYRARYFPKNSFLHANIGNNPSIIWRSVIEAHEIIRKGVRWRIGDGKDVMVWGELWLPYSSNLMIQIEAPSYLQEATVASLVNEEGTN